MTTYCMTTEKNPRKPYFVQRDRCGQFIQFNHGYYLTAYSLARFKVGTP